MQLLSSFGGEQMVPVSVFFTSDFVPLGKMLAANPQVGFAPTPGCMALAEWVRAGQERSWLTLTSESRRVWGAGWKHIPTIYLGQVYAFLRGSPLI